MEPHHECTEVIIDTEYWESGGKKIAYKHRKVGQRCQGVLLCNGLQQTMMDDWSRNVLKLGRSENWDAVVFDYHGIGDSSRFGTHDTSLASWTEDALSVLDNVCGKQPQVLVGYFTGAWVALHLALQRPKRIKALVLVSPGVDITTFWWQSLSPEDQQKCQNLRKVPLPPIYVKDGEGGGCLPLSFYEGCEKFLLLKEPSIPVEVPVRIYQGLKDTVVPPLVARELLVKVLTQDVHLTLLKGGDHALSQPEHLYTVLQGIEDMMHY